MNTRVIASTVMLLAAACGSSTHEPAPVAPPPAAPAPAAPPVSGPAQKGIAVADIDRAADPCNDFYAYANGAWRTANPIPAGKVQWSRRLAQREANRKNVRAIIAELAGKPGAAPGSPEQLVGDFYASCMAEAAIDAAGVTPIAPVLAELDGAKTAADIQRAIRRLHDLGVAAPFGELVAFENKEPKNTLLNITAGNLGLGDKALYAKADVVAKYRQHVARVLVLGGTAEKAAARDADGVVALEQRLAAVALDAAAAQDPVAVEHKTSYADLKKAAPHVEWDRYFDEAHLPREAVNVTEPRLLAQIEKELRTAPVATWRAYLKLQLLDNASPWLARPLADESFAFKGDEPPPRAVRCADLTESLLGEPVGKAYADRYFTPAAKAKAKEITANLLAVLKANVEGLAWMAPETRKKAVEKLGQTSLQLGYPDRWKDYSKVAIVRDALWANVVAARKFAIDDARATVGKPTNRDAWTLPPSSAFAYLDPQLNELVVPAGFLQPPYFDVTATDAVNYGAFGSGLAHDMTHAYDITGAVYDAEGRAQRWWTDADTQAFGKRAQCIVDQYEAYEIEPGTHHSGKLVLNEGLGDQAGTHFAFVAFKKAQPAAPTVDGFTPEQQFFLAWGQFRGDSAAIEAQRKLVQTDSHAMPKFRVNGPLSNLPEFAQAFGCKAGAPMVRAQRCEVW